MIDMEEKDFSGLRRRMVERQIRMRGVRDERVLEAILEVPRHEFVSPEMIGEAYEDGPLGIGEGQTISQPYIVAFMTEMARIRPDSKVLEVGTGSGYQTAVLSRLAREVFSIEIVDSLARLAILKLERLGYRNVHVRIGDGYHGWPEEAPFDSILVTAAPSDIPQPLLDQLKKGGRLVVPVGGLFQDLAVVTKTEDGLREEKLIPVRFVPMTGEAAQKRR
jgi:protein-L-isoaspartate(D-aspartate) O-methyltransferase